MINPYKDYLKNLFETVIDLRHSAYRIDSVLYQDVKIYTKEEARFFSRSALIIGDWTGPTDNGWEVNFYTGISKKTEKNNYAAEVKKIISRECCLAFAQSFEALEKFLKDCIFHKINADSNFKESLNLKDRITREDIRGGDELFNYFKKAGGNSYINYSRNNNKNIKFKELWTVLLETRHSITHSSSKIKKSKINRSKDHSAIFNYLFDHAVINEETIIIGLTYKRLEKLLKIVSEFGFQIFKVLSNVEQIDWDIR